MRVGCVSKANREDTIKSTRKGEGQAPEWEAGRIWGKERRKARKNRYVRRCSFLESQEARWSTKDKTPDPWPGRLAGI